jgi:hypothetical protein
MPLIFLDTPQIDLLEEKRRGDPVGYASFCDTWKRRGYTLVFTLTQAGELTRYGDASRREGRYQVLGELAPIRTDFPTRQGGPAGPRTLFEREILLAMGEHGLIPPSAIGPFQLTEWTDVLPGRLDASVADYLRATMENQDYQDVENRMYDAARFAAAAEKLDAQRKENPRVGDLPHTPVPPEKVPDCWAGFAKAVSLLGEESRLGKLPPIDADALQLSASLFQAFLSRAQEIGPRATSLEFLPVAGLTEPEQLKLTTDDRPVRWLFGYLVCGVARDLLGADDSEQESLARALDPADCPGFWLNWRLRLCVRRRSSKPRPSHHSDAARLAYLPYVDLLFTDAQMAEFVREVMRDSSTPDRIRALRPPVAISRSLNALEEALDSLSSRSTEAAART